MRVHKVLACLILAGVLTTGGAITGYAGQWTERDGTFAYLNDDGTYATNQWVISGDYWFYLDSDGYLLTDATTPDGYTVDKEGAWIVDGVVQIAETDTKKDARQAVYDNQNGSFSDKKDAVFNYLKALGYDTTGLSITKEEGIHYSSWGSFGYTDNLYNLLKYNSKSALNKLNYYINRDNQADDFIKAIDDYLNIS